MPVTRRRSGGAESPDGGSRGSIDSVNDVRDLCLRLLTARPRTREELRQALARRRVDERTADEVLSRLDEVGLVDDVAFAEQWVHSRHTYQGMARRALVAELRRKGVAGPVAAQAAAAVDTDAEEDRARQLVRRRLRDTVPTDEVAKARRLVGMLARKGYPEGLAYRVVREELHRAGHAAEPLDDIVVD